MTVCGDAQKFQGAFSSFDVYRWVGFRFRPKVPNFANFYQLKAHNLFQSVFLQQFGIVMGYKIEV